MYFLYSSNRTTVLRSRPLLFAIVVLRGRWVLSQDFASLPMERNYTRERVSSADPTGANFDGNWKRPIRVGEERTIAKLTWSGIITQMRFTIASDERYHLEKTVLRMYWDDHPLPDVECPIGDCNTVAYKYQRDSYKLRKALPPVDDRIPYIVNTGGPTIGKP